MGINVKDSRRRRRRRQQQQHFVCRNSRHRLRFGRQRTHTRARARVPARNSNEKRATGT